MKVTFYSTHCPKCKILEQKLKQKYIQYTEVDDQNTVVEYGIAHGIKSAPILDIDGKAYDFKAACDFLKTFVVQQRDQYEY